MIPHEFAMFGTVVAPAFARRYTETSMDVND